VEQLMNVILIIADTVRCDYCGCYGNTWVQTPNIDKLASESAIMENFFTASFPTGPMRKDVLSGRFTFTYTNWSQPRAKEELVLGELIKEKGYKTAFIGDTSNSPQFRQGFDYEQVISAQGSRLADMPEAVKLPADPRKLRIPMQRIQAIVRNAMAWDGEADRRTPKTMLAAHRWLEDQYSDDTPFFLYVDTFDPHEPWDEPRYYINYYDPGYTGDELMEPAYEPADYATQGEIEHMRCMYAGKLMMVDRWVGYLLEGVNRMGFADNTAIIFTSDHGFYHGEHNLIGKVLLDRDGAICGRWPLYSTISHPPLLIKIPWMTNGSRHDFFCQPPDVMATILELMNAPIPRRVQGQSLLPVIRREKDSIRDFAISSLTYIQDNEVRCPSSFRTKDYLYIYGGDEWNSELYDLKADPEETQNIIELQTDVAERLHERYLDFLKEIDCPKASLDARQEFNPKQRTNVPYRKSL
jgi:arylsulfatase A-like enzyme